MQGWPPEHLAARSRCNSRAAKRSGCNCSRNSIACSSLLWDGVFERGSDAGWGCPPGVLKPGAAWEEFWGQPVLPARSAGWHRCAFDKGVSEALLLSSHVSVCTSMGREVLQG